MSTAKVVIVMGSDNDLPVMEEAGKMLDKFGIAYEMTVASAHRTPARVSDLSRNAHRRGVEVIIAGAGAAAHLAGFIAAETTLPVIAVPIDSSPLLGLDALLAMVQMPGGVPVATVAIGKAGAKNAGILAAQILGIKYPEVSARLIAYKDEMAVEVEAKDKKLKEKLGKG
ncbi:MAG: 5-(carboxyamino)imidazole ribonucleotide mutase [Nitrospirota bacterium]|nr:5-(carboxyamino)imidazole ribonucleotide mutase [Nitrospirota bacterium]